MGRKIIIGTRGSELALWQANFLASELKDLGHHPELKIIRTQGDKIQHISLEKLEGKGFFTKEIEDALLGGEIDVAVHSHKDLPTENTPGLIIGGVSEREDCSEVVLIRKECTDMMQEFQLKQNAITGTSSSRRTAQLRFFRPDIIFKDIRGNVPTRVNKLRSGEFDAIILAYAGLHRLGLDLSDLHICKLDPRQFIPSPAQGVMAYQCREKDAEMLQILQLTDHRDVRLSISPERETLRLFKGGCHMPLGVFCTKENNLYHIWAAQAGDKEGVLRRLYYKSETPDCAEIIYQKLGADLPFSVFITRNIQEQSNYHHILSAAGCNVYGQSFVSIEEIPLEEIPFCDWLFFSSANGVQYFFKQLRQPIQCRIAALGSETAKAVHDHGYSTDFTGNGDTEQSLAEFALLTGGKIVCMPQALYPSVNAADLLPTAAATIPLPVYRNTVKHNITVEPADIVVFTSPLNANGYLQSNIILPEQKLIAIGRTTQKYLQDKGFTNVLIPPVTTLASVADLICGL